MEAPGSKLNWPVSGQAAVGIVDSAVLETQGSQVAAPIASTAKVITSLVVLAEKPLKPGETGPVITLTEADVALYQAYAAQNGSLVPVAAGEKINQYQMLQAIMLPSANNIADSLAIWAFGSLENYSAAANAWLEANDITNTKVGTDASGLSPSTTSTAGDLVKIGKLAMKQPVLAEIAGQATATGIPLTTSVNNYNSLLGTANIIGIKTGNTNQAGGVFISASRITVNKKPVTIITSFMGASDRPSALRDSLTLIQSAQANFSPATLVKAGQKVGAYSVPWDKSVDAVAKADLSTSAWNGSATESRVKLDSSGINNTDVGRVILDGASVGVEFGQEVPEPSLWWRLTHPLN